MERVIADTPGATEENGAFQGIFCFPLVEFAGGAATLFGLLDPVERKQGALDASYFAQCQRQSVGTGTGATIMGRTNGAPCSKRPFPVFNEAELMGHLPRPRWPLHPAPRPLERLDTDKLASALKLVEAGVRPAQAAKRLGLGRSTLYRELALLRDAMPVTPALEEVS